MRDRDVFRRMWNDLERWNQHTVYGKHYAIHIFRYHVHYHVRVATRKGSQTKARETVPIGASPLILQCLVIDLAKKHLGRDI